MVFSCWSAKGGSGTTVVSVALSVVLGQQSDAGSVFVDLEGDGPTVFECLNPMARASRTGSRRQSRLELRRSIDSSDQLQTLSDSCLGDDVHSAVMNERESAQND